MLDPRVQDGNKIPKWDSRTRLGQYLGKSSKHASLVGLIRNLRTGFISSQYHIIYDNSFHTVMGGDEDNDAIVDHIWSNLVADNEAVEKVTDTTVENQ